MKYIILLMILVDGFLMYRLYSIDKSSKLQIKNLSTAINFVETVLLVLIWKFLEAANVPQAFYIACGIGIGLWAKSLLIQKSILG